MEVIKKIEEVENYDYGDPHYSRFDGFKITTDKQEILLMISNDQSCCEDWGYFMSEDNIYSFIGSSLLDIQIVDTSLNQKEFDKKFEHGLDCGDVMFVNLNTDKGTLQFTAYNRQNGFYGHTAIVKSNSLNREFGL